MAGATRQDRGARPSKWILLAGSAVLGGVFTALALFAFTVAVVYNLLFAVAGPPSPVLALLLVPIAVGAGWGLRWGARRYRTRAIRTGSLVGGTITTGLLLVGLWLDFSGRPGALSMFAVPALLAPLLVLAAARLAAIPPRDDSEGRDDAELNIFFSYDSDDSQTVTRIKDGLEARAELPIDVYIYETDRRFDTSLSRKVKDEIGAADLLIVLITSNSQDSAWVQQEVGYADGVGCEVVPVLLDEPDVQEPTGLIGDIEYLTFDPQHPDDFFDKFLAYARAR